jgi:ANTAR domain
VEPDGDDFELVSTGVELASREVEVAQLRQALANRVWIEQAKGVLVATRGINPEAALDRAQDDADERERAADQRNHLADERERAADERDRTARDSE